MHALAITSISLIALTYVANFYNLGISNNSYEDQLGVAMLLAFVFACIRVCYSSTIRFYCSHSCPNCYVGQ